MFEEVFHSAIMGIHLTLEVKISFGNSTPVMGSSTESSFQKPRLSTNSRYRYHWKEEKENLHINSYKVKLDRLYSTRFIHGDQKTTT
jgi:hypothetical protein